MKKRFPKVYVLVIAAINAVLRWNRPYSIYITDSLGGSFKEYLLQHDMEGILAGLKRGLDAESVNTVDIMLHRMLHYPDERYKQFIRHKREMTGRLLPHETREGVAAIRKELNEIRPTFKGFSGPFEDSVFYYFHGLKLLPDRVQQYVKGHDFMDLGAFVGDSSIALSRYEYRKIFAVEMSGKSIGRYRTNMAGAGITADRYEIIQAAIAEKADPVPIRLKDTGSAGLSGFRNLGKYDEIEVYPVSADDLVRQYAIRPRFIKVDIEGYGLEFVKGALETIRTHRPVLSVAIYHNPCEFFEVKSWLESRVEGYVFMIRKLSCGIRYNECHSETVLLGYPEEIS